MKRILMMLALAGLLVVALSASALSALAASPSERNCEGSGGTFTRDGGQVKCETTTVDEGKPHPKDKFEEETTTTTTSNGTLNNRPQKEERQSSECTDTGSKKCPPGQF